MANQYSNQTDGSISLDDLVRRKLRVGDPKNPDQVVKALLDLYPQEKAKMEREAVGLPYIASVLETGAISPAGTVSPTESDFIQASADLDQDLNILVAEPALRNVAAGLRGWAQSVRKAVAEGVAAARLALDPGQRDKVFSYRRILGDYARLARYVGVLNLESNYKYRRLARSIDQVAALIMVQTGEAISKQAMSGFLLQVSLSEMQSRRAGVINALKNLLGSMEAAYDDETWGRGRAGYRALYDAIVQRNQPDLKVLILEPELSRVLNELVDTAGKNSAEGLSALGATSAVIVEKLQRLLDIGDSLSLDNQQPPVMAFLEALHLFIDAFSDNRCGLRLVDIARPPITFYGSRYGIGTANDSAARNRLLNLTIQRGLLAESLDDFLREDFSDEWIKAQIFLDKMLYDVDRAIDLYAQGTKNWGTAEQRAVAYALLIAGITQQGSLYLLTWLKNTKITLPNPITFVTDDEKSTPPLITYRKELVGILTTIAVILSPDRSDINEKKNSFHKKILSETIFQELSTQYQTEDRWLQLVQAVVPSNFP